jgi:uncharacterized protein YjbI with pentapeptide repeats
MPLLSRSAEILAAYAGGNRSFVSLDPDDEVHNFENATLVGADFTGTFVFANFRGANLGRSVFKNANVKTCDFSNSNLSGASFEGAAIDGALFTKANLEGGSFTGASEQGHVYQAGELPTQDAA